MQLIEKYIYAIGLKLPIDVREEIKLELKSLLLDEIEASYGENPTVDNVKKVIMEFGSPSEVASRYKNKNVVIDGKYTNLFFMIIKIIIFAMAVSFSVIFIIDLLTQTLTPINVLKSFLKLLSNILSASFGGIGALTLTFMLITRFSAEFDASLNEPWSIADLDNIKLEEDKKSKVSLYVEIFCSVIFIALIQKMPSIISYLESLVDKTGLNLGHYINPVVFKQYLVYIAFILVLEILANVVELVVENSKFLDILSLITKVLNIALVFAMVFDSTLYLNYLNIFGLRAIFIINAVVTSFEFFSLMYTFAKHHLVFSKT